MPHGALQHTVLLIAGMRGNVCRERMAVALQAVPGVRSVDVSLYRARATIVHDPKCAGGPKPRWCDSHPFGP